MSDCIGLLEPHIHDIFAKDRITNEDYIYTYISELFNTLEDYCDDQQIHEQRSPLLILGDSGSGKSALLANWLQRRQRNMTRSRAADDYVFYHAVGCTRHSTNVRNMMRRLLYDLKHRFELTRNVSLDPARLSWDIPRFLELASKKGKIIIVIDGLQRLESIEGETNLSWLPLEFPPNVRVIISATNPSHSDFSSKPSHVLAELERRKLQVLEVKPLEITICRSLVESYIKKTVQAETSLIISASASPSPSTTFLTSGESDEKTPHIPLTGLLFFEQQLEDIFHHRLSSNPLFLRLLLRSVYWAIHRGYCLWKILEDLETVDSMERLYHAILTLLENGYTCTPQTVESAKNQCISHGSLPALRELYPWHSSFQHDKNSTQVDMFGIDFHFNPTNSGSEGIRTTQSSNAKSSRHGSISSNINNLQTTGEAQWKIASQQAEAKLESIRVDTLREMDLIVKKAKELAIQENIKYVDAILRVQQQLLECEPENDYLLTKDELNIETEEEQVEEEQTEEISSVIEEKQDVDENQESRIKRVNNISEQVTQSSISHAIESIENISTDSNNTNNNNPNNNTSSKNNSPEKSVNKVKSDIILKQPSNLERNNTANNMNMSSNNILSGINSGNRKSSHSHDIPGFLSPAQSGRGSQRLVSVDSLDDQYRTSDHNAPVVVSDPIADLKKLPSYLIGGTGCSGFSTILGNALALLYVARHGLKETELWSILAKLPRPGNEALRQKSQTNIILTDEMKALISVCHHYREEFLKVWKANDILHTGRLTKGKLLMGMQRVNKEFTSHDIDLLLTILDCHPTQKGSSIGTLGNNKTISYPILVERLVRAQRVIKIKNKNKKQIKLTDDEIQLQSDPLFNSLHLGAEIDEVSLDSSSNIFSGNNSVFSENETSLGPILEEALLTALCALGVLHSPQNQVLVLPCEQELFRNVILDRYILANGGTLEEWHMKLIRFFEKKNNSHRRCEELPWHLKICRRWYSLKADVSHMDTFHTMLHGELRMELLGYWYTLTHSPLFVTDAAAEEANSGDNRSALSENQRVLSELDSAAALHLTQKDIKKQLLKDCVANFDIVDELGQSVENWINQSVPSSSRISEVILHIAKFIAEFCTQYETSPPPFLRIGIDKKCFSLFNVRLDIHTEVTHPQTDNDSNTNSVSDDITEKTHANPLMIGTHMMTLTKKETKLYHYFRWMWIQFPWLAMPSVSRHLSDEYASHIAQSDSVLKSLSHVDSDVIPSNNNSNNNNNNGNNANGNNSNGNGNNNLMSPVKVSKNHRKASIVRDDSNISTPNSKLEPQPSLTSPIKKSSKITSIDSLSSPLLSHEEVKRREVATRSWQAKKLDPSLGPVNSYSSSRTNSLVKSCLTPVSQLNAIENFGKHTLETVSLDVSINETSVVPGNHQSIDKYRCPLSVHLNSLSDIPFSQPSVRVLKKKSLFPSVVEMKEKVIENELNQSQSLSKLSTVKSRLYDDEKNKVSNNITLEEELNHLRAQEKLAALNRRGGNCIPCSTIEDAVNELELEKTGRYRAAYDKVRELRRQKELQLDEMKDSYQSREEIDTSVLATINSAECTMNLLEDRFLSLQSALTAVKQLNIGFSTLISFLQVNPPASETHLESLEQELKLACQQCEDLKKYRIGLYEDIDRIEKDRNISLREKIAKYKSQRQQFSKQLKDQREANRLLKEQLQNYSSIDNQDITIADQTSSPPQRSRERSINTMTQEPSNRVSIRKTEKEIISSSVTPTNISSFPNSLANLVKNEMSSKKKKSENRIDVTQIEEVLPSNVLEIKNQIDHLYELSGKNNPEEFIDAYRHAQKLYESMKQHQSLAESRINQLRNEEMELQTLLGETLFVASQDATSELPSATSERELRYLNQRLFKAEMRLNHNLRLADKAVLTINEVRTGVVHISSLLTCNDLLLQNLPTSNPPTLKSDGGIAKILAWCEERVLAINEALVLDASKPVVVDDGKSLYARQADLASVIQSMMQKKSGTPTNANKLKRKSKISRRESMSKSILHNQNIDFEILPTNEVGVRVLSQAEAEKIYLEKCNEAAIADNARAILQERAEKDLNIEDPSDTIRRVVSDGITSQEAANALRRANKMSNRKQGRRAGYGWTIEELLNDSASTFDNEYLSAKKAALKNKLTSQTPSRYELKQMSLARNRSNYLNEHNNNGNNVNNNNNINSNNINNNGSVPTTISSNSIINNNEDSSNLNNQQIS